MTAVFYYKLRLLQLFSLCFCRSAQAWVCCVFSSWHWCVLLALLFTCIQWETRTAVQTCPEESLWTKLKIMWTLEPKQLKQSPGQLSFFFFFSLDRQSDMDKINYWLGIFIVAVMMSSLHKISLDVFQNCSCWTDNICLTPYFPMFSPQVISSLEFIRHMTFLRHRRDWLEGNKTLHCRRGERNSLCWHTYLNQDRLYKKSLHLKLIRGRWSQSHSHRTSPI